MMLLAGTEPFHININITPHDAPKRRGATVGNLIPLRPIIPGLADLRGQVEIQVAHQPDREWETQPAFEPGGTQFVSASRKGPVRHNGESRSSIIVAPNIGFDT